MTNARDTVGQNPPRPLVTANNTVVQDKYYTAANIHTPFKIQPWLATVEVTEPQMARLQTLAKGALKTWQGFGGALLSVTDASRRLRSTTPSFPRRQEILLNLLPLGLLRPQKPITFFKHALYQGPLSFLGNPQDITGSGELFRQFKGQTTFLQQRPGPVWAHGLG